MNLYIRIKDGQPVDHPIIEENFIQAFPDIDINNLPPEFARFNRLEMPHPLNILEHGKQWQKIVHSYVKNNDIDMWEDFWEAVDLTEEEISAAYVEKNKQVQDWIERHKEYAKIIMEDITDEDMPVLQEYMNVLDSLTWTDPFDAIRNFPNLPFKIEDGSWVKPWIKNSN
jgi:hypothetical protein